MFVYVFLLNCVLNNAEYFAFLALVSAAVWTSVIQIQTVSACCVFE